MESPNSIKLFVASWNVGNEKPERLENLLPVGGGGFDLIVFGMQESTYNLDSEDCIQDLKVTIINIVGENYKIINHNRRAQMQVYVLANNSTLSKYINNVEANAENTGLLGIFPNKGGLLVGMEILGSRIAFISTHLAAHEGVSKCSARNDSVIEILGGVRTRDLRYDTIANYHHVIWMGDLNYRLTFDTRTPDKSAVASSHFVSESVASESDVILEVIAPPQVYLSSASSAEFSSTESMFKQPQNKLAASETIDDDDEDEGIDDEKRSNARSEQMQAIYKMIENMEWNRLLDLDELNREIAAGRIFKGFSPLRPSFPPTFKRRRNMALIDANGTEPNSTTTVQSNNRLTDGLANQMGKYYDPKRLPSYTDRILYTSWPGFKDNLKPLSFSSYENVPSSDHKPVAGVFQLDLTPVWKDIDWETKHKKKFRLGVSQKASSPAQDDIQVKLCNLAATGLVEMDSQISGGLSDPYIIISTDPAELLKSPTDSRSWIAKTFSCMSVAKNTLSNEIKTSIISHTINPEWKDDITLGLKSTDIEGLSKSLHFVLSVWDADMMNEDDLIGVCIVPFSAVVKEAQKEVAGSKAYIFDQPILHQGVQRGRLSGHLSLLAPVQQKPVILLASENAAL